ncbi:flagellar protein FlaG [Thiomicrorhabdus sp. 6S2-11]|uniref:Flagellar protein FlaG n=1 Tax=Thiomicrorhabdus marina TaxID=2818442 RepID=A0ABS3Q813_9GAMM|nr:flagellar protein FlaG [Thiomicrorhabdus marina]MBO1928386.1 flagellar protein FlaG [Thiomicrorhabdus marina]
MEVSALNTSIETPSTQKVTEVTNRVEGVSPQDSSSISQQAVSVSKEQIEPRVEQINRQLEKLGQSITFGVDESTNQTVVQVFDKSTDELIKQFPTEDSLKFIKNIQDYLERIQETGSDNKESLTGQIINEII